MTRSTTLAALTVAFLAALPLAAQEPANMAGKWEFSYSTQRGATTIAITFEQDGETLTGSASMGGQRGGTAEVKGTIKGNDLSFALIRTFNENTFEQTFTGKVTGDAAEGTMSGGGRRGGGQPISWTAKRLPPGTGAP